MAWSPSYRTVSKRRVLRGPTSITINAQGLSRLGRSRCVGWSYPFTNYYRPFVFRGIYAETRSRYLDGSLVRRDFLVSSRIRMNPPRLSVAGRTSNDPHEWGKLPRRQLSIASLISRYLQNIRGPGQARSLSLPLLPRAQHNVISTREAIPLNRLCERKRREDSKHGMDLKGPCNSMF